MEKINKFKSLHGPYDKTSHDNLQFYFLELAKQNNLRNQALIWYQTKQTRENITKNLDLTQINLFKIINQLKNRFGHSNKNIKTFMFVNGLTENYWPIIVDMYDVYKNMGVLQKYGIKEKTLEWYLKNGDINSKEMQRILLFRKNRKKIIILLLNQLKKNKNLDLKKILFSKKKLLYVEK